MQFQPLTNQQVAGSAERLRDECVVLASRAHQAKMAKLSVPLPVTLQIFDDMPHSFQSFLFHPSANRSMEWSCNFLKRCLSSDKDRVSDDFPISDRPIDPKGPWAWRIDANLTSHPIDEYSEFDYLTEYIK
ncbi:hypothetical protein DSO57_1019264 [Entomophthora muscae]|uniref:Uncharacterized protein n=1 Tax=Entomophthora muscae TaxID=34485 RepID=A0ACC2UPX8_9FUNG|nr:hypothetical protein DSO57_1019264 [Entomophthora muscae]